ncbi:MAG: sodium:solute symporter [Bacteroidota bacterium]|nr:sodium:solute symporter [Bacteroidota bacterium]
MNISCLILIILIACFGVLMLISAIVGRKHGTRHGNDSFFIGSRQSPWYVVAIGMIGSSISGVSFVSVPGMVRENSFFYMQTVVGFFFGYLIIANVLLPMYYKLKTASIYEYLLERFGQRAYKTGASFFILAQSIGSAARAYIVVIILQTLVLNQFGIPFAVTAFLFVGMIWLYTFKEGIRTLVWTDAWLTLVLIGALAWMIIEFGHALGQNIPEVIQTVKNGPYAQWIELTDWHNKQYVLKQFFSGIFIALVMTGLNQDMIQKNRTISQLHKSQKNMYWYGFAFIPLNLLFLTLGALMLTFANEKGIALPASSDEILPMLATKGYLNPIVTVLFTIGIVSASFSSTDSSMTSLTTSFCIDIAGKQQDERFRKRVHAGFALLFVGCILLFRLVNHHSLIDTIYVIVSYTYGPLLGLFSFGLLTKRTANDKIIPWIAVASPIICYILQLISTKYAGYSFGYELLMLNGFLTFSGLWLTSNKSITYGNI